MKVLTNQEQDIIERSIEIEGYLSAISEAVEQACKYDKESEIRTYDMILTKHKLEIDLLIHALSVHTQYTKIQNTLNTWIQGEGDLEEDDK